MEEEEEEEEKEDEDEEGRRGDEHGHVQIEHAELQPTSMLRAILAWIALSDSRVYGYGIWRAHPGWADVHTLTHTDTH